MVREGAKICNISSQTRVLIMCAQGLKTARVLEIKTWPSLALLQFKLKGRVVISPLIKSNRHIMVQDLTHAE